MNLNKIKIGFSTVADQLYIFPYVKITYSRYLNGDLELILGWFNYQVYLAI